VKDNYITEAAKRKAVFRKVSDYFESIYGFNNEITLGLKKNLDEPGEIDEIDKMFGNYSISSHLQDDLYSTK